MRLLRVLLLVLVIGVATIARAETCPARRCVFVPFTSSGSAAPPAAPIPSTAPVPSTTPSPSTAPGPQVPPVARWTEGNPSPIKRSEAEGAAINNKLYVFGGYSYPLNGHTPYGRVDVYDVANDTWTRLRDLPRPVNHSGVATDGRYVYFAGGYVANSAQSGAIFGSREVWAYDSLADTYTAMPPLPLDRAAGQLVLVGRSLYFFGGTNQERTADTGEHWALALDNQAAGWQVRAALPNPRNHLGAVELGGKIWAIGGQHGHDGALVTQREVHMYDPLTDAWTAMAPLPEVVVEGKSYGRSHIGGSTFVRNGKIVVAGGEFDHMRPVRDIVEYDPAGNVWSTLAQLPDTRYSGVARQFGEKLVYATGVTENAELTNTTLIGSP